VAFVPAGCSAVRSGRSALPGASRALVTTAQWNKVEADPNAFRGAPTAFVGRVFAPYDPRQTPPSIQVFAGPDQGKGVTVVAVASDPGVKAGGYVAVTGTILGEFKGAGMPFSGTGVTAVLVRATSVDATVAPPGPSGQ
jgi:hypothetical protein